jgi:uncharacterized protein (TIGR03435 family)
MPIDKRCAKGATNCLLVLLAMVTLEDISSAGQLAPADQNPSFEVASVRKVGNDEGVITITFDPERVLLRAPLRMIIGIAYELRQDQPTGGPGWVDTDSFEIMATTGRATTTHEKRLMLRGLLAERFKLQTSMEQHEADVLEMMVVNPQEMRFVKTDVDCASLDPKASVPPKSRLWCGLRGTGPGLVTAQGATMAQFAGMVSVMAGRPVFDATGLDGRYDFVFEWFPGKALEIPLETALADQLGLRLKGSRRVLTSMRVTAVEQPTEN